MEVQGGHEMYLSMLCSTSNPELRGGVLRRVDDKLSRLLIKGSLQGSNHGCILILEEPVQGVKVFTESRRLPGCKSAHLCLYAHDIGAMSKLCHPA